MADLLPALSGLNQLLLKKVELQKEEEKKKKGAELVSEYETKLRGATNSQELSSINTWFLGESERRGVPQVQQTGYYMYNNYSTQFQEREKEKKYLDKIESGRKGFEDFWKQTPIIYNGQQMMASDFVQQVLKSNPNASYEELNSQIKEMMPERSEDLKFDMNKKQIVKVTNVTNKLGYNNTSVDPTIWSVNQQGEIFIDVGGTKKITTKDPKTGKEITKEVTGQEGIYDEGVDQKISSEELLKYKSGEEIAQALYQLNPANQPVPRGGGGRGGGRGGSGGSKNPYIAPTEKRYKSYGTILSGLIDRYGKFDGKDLNEAESIDSVGRWLDIQERLKESENYADIDRVNAETSIIEDITAEYFSERFAWRGQDKDKDINNFRDPKVIVGEDGSVQVNFPRLDNRWYPVDDPNIKQGLIYRYQVQNLK